MIERYHEHCRTASTHPGRRANVGHVFTLLLFIALWTTSGFVSVTAWVRPIEDADIRAALISRIARDEAVAGALIDVETQDGVVTLSGWVDHLLARDRAVQIAESTKGVRAVVNRMQIRPVQRPDGEIEEDIKRGLMLDPVTGSYEVDVSVQGARATLTGDVDSHAKRDLVVQIVKAVKGIAEIRDDIEILYAEDRTDGEIQAEIVRRLASNAYVNSETLTVEVDDGRVTLGGTVGSALERSKATQLAWVSGVRHVDSSNVTVEWPKHESMKQFPRLGVRSDREIEKAVTDALSYDPRVVSSMIDVNSTGGLVTLTGRVDTLLAKKAAQQDVRNTIGVWRVDNRIKVRPDNPPSDRFIRKQVEESLARDVVLEPYSFRVQVRNQKVYLHGEAPHHHARNRAENVAARVEGVVTVANHIRVVSPAAAKSDREIRQGIEDHLFWSPFIDEGSVQVEVVDGVATLRGGVESGREFEAVLEGAFQAGARGVENELKIRDAPTQIYPQRYYPFLFWGL